VRVLDAEGQQIGVMPIEEAIKRAEEAGLDLIEVAATAEPPVCRIADLGKFKFESDKRARDAKKNQHVSEVKEVRIRPRTDDHDLQVRVRAARRFLEEGHKVKVEVRFRGREATHPEVARDQIGRIAAGVADIAIVERSPSMEGRAMFAILARGRATAQPGPGQAAPRPSEEAAPRPASPPRAAAAPAAPPAKTPAAPAPAATAALLAHFRGRVVHVAARSAEPLFLAQRAKPHRVVDALGPRAPLRRV